MKPKTRETLLIVLAAIVSIYFWPKLFIVISAIAVLLLIDPETS